MIYIAIERECVRYPLDAANLSAAVAELVDLAAEAGHVNNPEELKAAVLSRETVRPSCNTVGVAVPRGCANGVRYPMMMVGLPKTPFACTADGRHPVNLVVLLVAPKPKGVPFLKALMFVMKKISEPESRDLLMTAESEDDLYDRLKWMFPS